MSQAVPKGRGRARGRAGPRPEEEEAAAAAAPAAPSAPVPAAATAARPAPPGLGIGPYGPGVPSRPAEPPSVMEARAAGRAVERGGGGATGDPGHLAERMAGLRVGGEGGAVGGERGGLQRKLLRYSMANVRPATTVTKKGNAGSAVQVVTNFVRINTQENWTAYQLAAEFRPFLGAKPLREQLLKEAEQVPKPFVYDGGCLYSTRPLAAAEGIKFAASIKSWSGEVAIRQVGIVNKNTPQWLHLLNVVLGMTQRHMNMQMVGRNYYYPDQATKLAQHRMEVWPGFEMAIKPSDGPLMLHVDVSHKVIHMSTVLDVMYEIFQRSGEAGFHAAATEAFVGQIVLTRHNNKTYRIDGIEWEERISRTFTLRNRATRQDETISIAEYFLRTYNTKLVDTEQPLLLSKPRKRDLPPTKGGKREVAETLFLPPELCYMTGLTDDMRADRNLMKDLATFTRIDPSTRCGKLVNFARTMSQNPACTKVLSEFGLAVTPNPVEAIARQLPPETVNMSRPIQVDPERADWDNALKTNGMFQPVNCKNWIFIYSQRDESAAADFCEKLSRASRTLGMQFGEPYVLPVAQDRDPVWVKIIEDNITPDLDLVFCLLPSNKKQRYDAIKRQCYVNKPVPSQCVMTRTIRNPAKVMSVATKVALQISCKLGGIAWAVTIPLKTTMIVGMDSYHDKKQSVSVQGVVFSLNNTFTQYFSYAPIVKGGKAELHKRLEVGFTMALQKYREINGDLPSRIILYRDGVGDSMLEEVKNSELMQLQQALGKIYGDRIKTLGFKAIVVKKLVSSRMFRKQGANLRNPAPGTVLDDVITMPNFVDFFLVSQYVNQGTVTPTHYNMIEDLNDPNIKADQVQQLTYKLCHLYFNWPGTIRVPAPCHYAHRLAYLVGQNLMEEPHPQICDRLFFL